MARFSSTSVAACLVGACLGACSNTNSATLVDKPWSGASDRIADAIRRGADVNVRDKNGMTPLHNAAAWGKDDIVRMLLGRGAAVDARDRQGNTPLHFASASLVREERPFPKQNLFPDQAGQTRAAALLLDGGADPNAANDDGNTPLHLAAAHSSLDTAKLLAGRRGDPNARNTHGETPLHLAVADEAVPVMVELLLQSGADPNARDERGLTPLHRMVHRSLFDAQVVVVLVRGGADPQARSADGITPLELMAKYGSKERCDEMRQAIEQGQKRP